MKNLQLPKFAALAGVLAFLWSTSAYGAALLYVNLTNTITASMDGGVAKTGDTWYQFGINAAAPTTGIKTGLITAEYDPFSTYLIQPATGLNALLLDSSNKTASITFSRPISVTGLSLLGASGHGRGTNDLTLNFSDGSSSILSGIIVGDWFNNTQRVQTANGRINIFANTFDNVASDNPRILAVNAALALADQSKFLTGINFSWTGSATNTETAIFGISGDVTGIGHFTAIPLTPGSFNQDIIVGALEVPEPEVMALVCLGVVSLLVRNRRTKN